MSRCGIDDGGQARLLVADEIRRVGEAVEVELLENHGVAPANASLAASAVPAGANWTTV